MLEINVKFTDVLKNQHGSKYVYKNTFKTCKPMTTGKRKQKYLLVYTCLSICLISNSVLEKYVHTQLIYEAIKG